LVCTRWVSAPAPVARSRAAGRDPGELHCSVALRDPGPGDIAALSELGVDQLVVVDSPPADPDQAAAWVKTLAARWLS
jgi:hypothetical protein